MDQVISSVVSNGDGMGSLLGFSHSTKCVSKGGVGLSAESHFKLKTNKWSYEECTVMPAVWSLPVFWGEGAERMRLVFAQHTQWACCSKSGGRGALGNALRQTGQSSNVIRYKNSLSELAASQWWIAALAVESFSPAVWRFAFPKSRFEWFSVKIPS